MHIKIKRYPTLEEVERGYPLKEDYEYPEELDLPQIESLWLCAWVRLLPAPGQNGEDIQQRREQASILQEIVRRLEETQALTGAEKQGLGVRPFRRSR
jgi:hypothetical protein